MNVCYVKKQHCTKCTWKYHHQPYHIITLYLPSDNLTLASTGCPQVTISTYQYLVFWRLSSFRISRQKTSSRILLLIARWASFFKSSTVKEHISVPYSYVITGNTLVTYVESVLTNNKITIFMICLVHQTAKPILTLSFHLFSIVIQVIVILEKERDPTWVKLQTTISM